MKDDSRYDALHDVDGGSDSSTEVDEWDLEDREKLRSKKGVWRKAKSWRWALDTVLIVVIFGLLVERRWKEFAYRKSHKYENGGDLTGFAPPCMSTYPARFPLDAQSTLLI